MKQIKRYNQGFGFFGPLEECNTGKLMLYKDHVETLCAFRKDRRESEERMETDYRDSVERIRGNYLASIKDLTAMVDKNKAEARKDIKFWSNTTIVFFGLFIISISAHILRSLA